MATPNRTVWRARQAKKFFFEEVSSHSSAIEANAAADEARKSGKWTRVKVWKPKWSGFHYVQGVRV
jgi:hypothetical protein